ncbi:EAL domain-containing protein [Maricaulis sp.]|uniref:putative bifunctional diguanylate cyclase/phosphodiesterase n=1 Tax=Maricaulis sp. TaxID=1486257 RepID=UPI0025C0D60B|nr:EAL domain-containing protein [Maricaulis sp.]
MKEVMVNSAAVHDVWLLGVAALLSLVCAVAAIAAVRRILILEDERRLVWLTVAGFLTGIGSWGAGFVATMGFNAGVTIAFDPFLVLSSFLVVVGMACAGWTVMAFLKHKLGSLVGGATVGAGAAAMIYFGLNAISAPVPVGWSEPVACLGMAAVVGVTMLSALLASRVTGAVGLALAASVLASVPLIAYFTLTQALEVSQVELMQVAKLETAPKLMGLTIALGILPIAGLGLSFALFDLHIGKRREAEGQRINALANSTFEGLVLVQDGRIVEVNERICEITGLEKEDLINMPLCKVGLDEASVAVLQGLECGDKSTCRLRSRSEQIITAQVSCRGIEFRNEDSLIIAFRDISSEERSRQRIMHMAHHDALTGLPNRLRFREALENELTMAWGNHTEVALMFFDLDRFKEVNDVHGHAAGDELLKTVAERMQDALPKGAIAARLSGDEFAVILPDCESRMAANAVAERVVASVGSPVTIGSVHLNVSASGGVTMFPLDGEDPDRLMNQADLALYKAKHLGRNCVCDFDPKMGRELQEKRMLESDLAMAIEDELLDLHFQPQSHLGTGEIRGFEALVRWEDEVRGFVSPAEFIQLAEESGQILKLGQWVLETACREAVYWPEGQRVAVNVSPAQFKQGNFILSVERALAKSGLEPHRLEIEITEGVVIDDEARALTLMRRLKELGVGLSMDDFGTGYASLNYLRAFPFDKIKIDRSFISGLQNEPEAQIIVASTIELAHQLGMGVVVEGIEDLDEMSALGDQPEVLIQGYLLSRPLTRGQLPEFLKNPPDLAARAADHLCEQLQQNWSGGAA